tara:strand:- start:392 stop:634 length:243 start_codon:yes stop_codon:yes gene_type:complete
LVELKIAKENIRLRLNSSGTDAELEPLAAAGACDQNSSVIRRRCRYGRIEVHLIAPSIGEIAGCRNTRRNIVNWRNFCVI